MDREGKTILIADDDMGIRKSLQARLSSGGYSPVLASGGREAIELFTQHTPDVVVLDACMPDMSGFEVCEAIRSRPGGTDLPIVFLTGSEVPSPDYVARCADIAGASHFVRKPFDSAELLDLLAKLTDTTAVG